MTTLVSDRDCRSADMGATAKEGEVEDIVQTSNSFSVSNANFNSVNTAPKHPKSLYIGKKRPHAEEGGGGGGEGREGGAGKGREDGGDGEQEGEKERRKKDSKRRNPNAEAASSSSSLLENNLLGFLKDGGEVVEAGFQKIPSNHSSKIRLFGKELVPAGPDTDTGGASSSETSERSEIGSASGGGFSKDSNNNSSNNNSNNKNNNNSSGADNANVTAVWEHCERTNEWCPAYGLAAMCGGAKQMEDAARAVTGLAGAEGGGSEPLHSFGVYDGHGGSQVSRFCFEQLHSVFLQNLERLSEVSSKEENAATSENWDLTSLIPAALESAFLEVDAEVNGACTCAVKCSNEKAPVHTPIAPDTVGSTAVVVILSRKEIFVANCGDSRAVLCRAGQAIPLSSDHKPGRLDEMQRIESSGGKVLNYGGYRVMGILAVSRAIGRRPLFEAVRYPSPGDHLHFAKRRRRVSGLGQRRPVGRHLQRQGMQNRLPLLRCHKGGPPH